MPTNYPQRDSAVEPNLYGMLAVCALILGTAVLFLDFRSGATSHRGLLLVVGIISLGGAVVLSIIATFSRHRPASTRR